MQLPTITNKQTEILIHLYRFRFLNRHHIQSLLNHKDYKLINIWLTDLTKKGYLNRIYSTTYGENTKPAIYSLATKARHVLKKQEDINVSFLNRIYRERTRSQLFIDHCLSIANIYFSFLKKSEQNKSNLFFYTQTDLSKFPFLDELKPDIYIAIEKEGRDTKRYFVEVVDDKTPRYVLRHRIQAYINFCDEGEWETNTTYPFPIVLFICPNLGTKIYLIKHMEENEDDATFFFLTKEEIFFDKIHI